MPMANMMTMMTLAHSPRHGGLALSLAAKQTKKCLHTLSRNRNTKLSPPSFLEGRTAHRFIPQKSSAPFSNRARHARRRPLLSSSTSRPLQQQQQHRSPLPRANNNNRNWKRGKATLSQESASTTTGTQYASRTSASSNRFWSTENLAAALRQQRTLPVPRWISPGFQTICISEVFGHSSFVLVAISYAVDDFLMLRCIAVVASGFLLIFTYFHPHGRVLWLPFKWNALFIAINSYRIGKVFLDRHFAESLSDEFMKLRDEHFHLMDSVDFAKIVRLGKVESFRPGQQVVGQGEEGQFVRLVVSGELEVFRDGKITYMIEEGSFVSESGLHAGIMLPGSVNSCCTVKAKTESRLLAWDRTELLHLLEMDSNVHRSLQNAMSWDIVRKLKTQRLLLSSGRVEDPEQWTERRKQQSLHRYTAILKNLLQHNRLLNAGGRENLQNYRIIHHIEDEDHLLALKECGWTPEEFELGRQPGWKPGSDDGDHDSGTTTDERKTLRWYLRSIYLKLFG